MNANEETSHDNRHSLAEDAYAFVISSTVIVIGITMLKAGGVSTGGMPGAALLLSYVTGVSATTILFLINMPFYWLAARVVSMSFAVKSFLASLLIALMGIIMPDHLRIADIDPLFAALSGGSLVGLGILILARHGAGVGGFGIVALMLQRSKEWNAGRTQMAGDVVILLASLMVLDWRLFLLSIVSAVAINSVLMVNHRPQRYIGR